MAVHQVLHPGIRPHEAAFVDKWSSGDFPHNGQFEALSYVSNYRLTQGYDVISFRGWHCHMIRPLANQDGSLWRAIQNGNVRPMIIRPAPAGILYINLQARLEDGFVWLQGTMLSGRVAWKGRQLATLDVRMSTVSARVRTVLLRQNIIRSTNKVVFMGHTRILSKTAKLWSPHVKKSQYQKQLPKRRMVRKTDPRYLALGRYMAPF
ncbi:unnamed protein product [Symbiodinium sp. CCMP2592]|nr:unnamed protein product [Symbiodinium sp. CCMP2592]